ncbi:MAG: hypothetical protein DRQ65_03555 [Gammaproteobacteria bacterium]|nr:MAG: hypothetical protein DRQ65_03555 [Gammaproteobacteria bacterium]RLA56361.1 MAG: hypothetical protein DRQ98_02435 [Gammaproteobacteria bacterium]HDY83603.1 hypothetical protein [Halieaceae bacterium]
MVFLLGLCALLYDEHIDGTYALGEVKHEQWLEMEEFPPYEFAVDDGEQMYDTPFANGTKVYQTPLAISWLN